MKKIKFDVELKEFLRKLQERLGNHIPDAKMKGIFAGGGCGEQCKITCAWWCRPDIVSSEIAIDPQG